MCHPSQIKYNNFTRIYKFQIIYINIHEYFYISVIFNFNYPTFLFRKIIMNFIRIIIINIIIEIITLYKFYDIFLL